MRQFFMRLMGITDTAKLIEEKFAEMQQKVFAEVASLRADNSSLKADNSSLKQDIISKDNRITELLTKIRDQSEADIILEIKKLEKRILEGEKAPDLTSYNLALAQMNCANQQLAGFNRHSLIDQLSGRFL
jgi:hypothetical protein